MKKKRRRGESEVCHISHCRYARRNREYSRKQGTEETKGRKKEYGCIRQERYVNHRNKERKLGGGGGRKKGKNAKE